MSNVRRSQDYLYTITDLSASNPDLIKSRAVVKEHNTMYPSAKLRISVKYRLGKNNPNAHLYRGRYCYSVLKEHAQHADVYMYVRR